MGVTCDPPTWGRIPGFPDYEASTDGRIRRVTPAKTRGVVPYELRGQATKSGYRSVRLSRPDGSQVEVLIHRLVLLTFVGEPPLPGMHGCHNNGCPTDNRLSNLRWDTCKGNLADRRAHGTQPEGERNGRAKLTSEQVEEIRRTWTGARGQMTSFTKTYGVSHRALWAILRGRTWAHVAVRPPLEGGLPAAQHPGSRLR